MFLLNYKDEKIREAVRRVCFDYKGTKAVLSEFNPELRKGPVTGSNIYARFALANHYRIITGYNARPITPNESEIAIAEGSMNFGGICEDLGLIIYPKVGDNPNLWEYLREQVKFNFQNIDLEEPFVFTGLADVVKDHSYEYGLRLDVNELTEVYTVPILNQKRVFYQRCFDSDDPELRRTGFPNRIREKIYINSGLPRSIYIGTCGVSKFFRGEDLSLSANSGSLDSSHLFTGRIHFNIL